eukprot:CAMPEP_0178448800 /NCGR_PEP_ID=MMETSP0689_2-20121128/42192_1 /TAXON_ID=160604 /ORGANISM="Amphidinium massartii, Strain CS-259" /LENGTH=191 /DNA_ID=CAMNT_0020074039 /DNA_START=178 /DNA_END=749 /DNA_ORIENTATION=-
MATAEVVQVTSTGLVRSSQPANSGRHPHRMSGRSAIQPEPPAINVGLKSEVDMLKVLQADSAVSASHADEGHVTSDVSGNLTSGNVTSNGTQPLRSRRCPYTGSACNATCWLEHIDRNVKDGRNWWFGLPADGKSGWWKGPDGVLPVHNATRLLSCCRLHSCPNLGGLSRASWMQKVKANIRDGAQWHNGL